MTIDRAKLTRREKQLVRQISNMQTDLLMKEIGLMEIRIALVFNRANSRLKQVLYDTDDELDNVNNKDEEQPILKKKKQKTRSHRRKEKTLLPSKKQLKLDCSHSVIPRDSMTLQYLQTKQPQELDLNILKAPIMIIASKLVDQYITLLADRNMLNT